MNGTEINHVATYARKLTEIQTPGAQYNSAPLTAGGRTDIVGISGPTSTNQGNTIPYGRIYGTTSNSDVPSGSYSYNIQSASGITGENVWELGLAESYCSYPDQILPKSL